MKKILQFLLLALPMMAYSSLSAQICTPDTSYTSPGFYPSVMPQACVNQAYNFGVTLLIPQDTTVNVPPFGNVTIPIDSLNLVGVLNMPASFSYQCSPSTCSFPGNSYGCVVLAGTPTLLGNYPLDIIVDVWVTAPIIGSTSFRDTIIGAYSLSVVNPPVASITGPSAICSGGTATLDAGAGFSDYLWSNGDTTQTSTVNAAGFYWVKVFSGSCMDSTGITLTQNTAPAISVSVVDATCGQTNGSATATPTGNGPFTYLWSNGQTSATAMNLAAGAYSVTVTDANTCSSSQNVSVNSIGGPAVTQSTLTDVSCAGASDGAATVNVSGGTTPYTFSWSNGATTQNLSGVSGGTYLLTVTDSNSCVSTLSVTITEPGALAATLAGKVNVSCNGGSDGSATLAAAGGTTPYQYRWSDGQTTVTATSLLAGAYQAIVTDVNGCTDTVAVTLSEPTALVLQTGFTSTTPSIKDGKAWVTPSGGTPPYSYSWDNGGSTDTLSNLAPGSYTVTVTDANGCEEKATVNVVDVTGIAEDLTAGVASLKLFPNPTHGAFTLQLQLDRPDEVRVSLFDASGRELMRKAPVYTQQWNAEFDLGGLPSGLYLVRVQTTRGATVRKMMMR